MNPQKEMPLMSDEKRYLPVEVATSRQNVSRSKQDVWVQLTLDVTGETFLIDFLPAT
jgi:hypothetical protein